jgi:glutamyl-tRNA reductase
MPIVVVGLNHKTAPIALLGRLTIADDALPKALHHLSNYEHVVEGVVLSTCNRIEVYAVVTKFHGGALDLRNFLAEFCHVPPEEFGDHLYTYYDDGAVRHLFRVAAGIDSMVIGESEILGQVRHAHRVAAQEGLVQRILGRAFNQALHAGKAARTDTAIGRNPASISSAAVDLARRAFPGGSLEGKRVVVVGAGKMGRLALTALGRAGAEAITVVNRSPDRARAMAGTWRGVTWWPWDRLGEALAEADIVICSTTAPHHVIDSTMVESALAHRSRTDPLLFVDIAVPPDVDPSVAARDGVVVRDLEDLRQVVEATIGGRLAEVSKVEAIVAREVERFLEWERASEIAPTVARLVARAEEVRRAELERLRRHGSRLSEEQLAAADAFSRRVVAKLLHEPITKAKEMPSSKRGQLYLSALRELFDLDEDEH